jgi:hypothetical protein
MGAREVILKTLILTLNGINRSIDVVLRMLIEDQYKRMLSRVLPRDIKPKKLLPEKET